MKVAVACTIALACVLGMTIADDFNNFNNFDNDDGFGGFGSFGSIGGSSVGVGYPSYSSYGGGYGGSYGGGYSGATFLPIPVPSAPVARSTGGGLGGLALLFFFLIFLFSGNTGTSDQIILLNSTLTG